MIIKSFISSVCSESCLYTTLKAFRVSVRLDSALSNAPELQEYSNKFRDYMAQSISKQLKLHCFYKNGELIFVIKEMNPYEQSVFFKTHTEPARNIFPIYGKGYK